MTLAMKTIFVAVVGTAAAGCLINGSPNNMAAAAIFCAAIYELTWRAS